MRPPHAQISPVGSEIALSIAHRLSQMERDDAGVRPAQVPLALLAQRAAEDLDRADVLLDADDGAEVSVRATGDDRDDRLPGRDPPLRAPRDPEPRRGPPPELDRLLAARDRVEVPAVDAEQDLHGSQPRN